MRWIVIIALWLGVALPALAAERILSFDSEIDVERDGSLVVTETIRVQAEGRDIRRGIYRDFPTDYTAADGRRTRVGFEVLGVRRDREKESYHTERLSNGVRVYMGRGDRLLRPGVYTYELRYRTTGQLGFFDTHDELYWNVTGNDWAFPMDRVRALVSLPHNITPTDMTYYTGRQGETGKHATAYGAGNGVVFETTKPLAPGEGLTIVVAWPKGYVEKPSAATAWLAAGDMARVWTGMGGLALICLYYLAAWRKVGRDPVAGPIYPRYEPPANLAPAGMRYISRMGYDHKAFAAALVSLAVKGAIKMHEEESGQFRLEKTVMPQQKLSPGETAVLRVMFSAGEPSITLKPSEHRLVRRAIAALKERLAADYDRVYFLTNRPWLIPGIALSLLLLGGLALLSQDPYAALFQSVWLAGWSAGCYVLLLRVKAAWAAYRGGGVAILRALAMTAFAVPFLSGLVAGTVMFAHLVSVAAALMALSVVMVNLLFLEWMKAHTPMGRQVMDAVEGFKLYLSVAEQDRLDFAHAPERTPELFEKYLPFAMALDVETRWGEKFADVLEKAVMTDGYQPRWYSGSQFSPHRLQAFPAALGAGVAGAVAAASQAPGSRSGFSGGSSGGGGGGGGGGGW